MDMLQHDTEHTNTIPACSAGFPRAHQYGAPIGRRPLRAGHLFVGRERHERGNDAPANARHELLSERGDAAQVSRSAAAARLKSIAVGGGAPSGANAVGSSANDSETCAALM
jgi:hypothetical protein